MIIFLYGQDAYRSKEKLREIIERYKEIHKSGLNLSFFNEETANYQGFRDALWQSSMFQEKKLVVLKNVFQNADFKNAFLTDGQRIVDSKDIVVFCEEGEIPANDPLFKFLKKNAESQEFQLLRGQKLKNWIKKEFKRDGIETSPQVHALLAEYAGNDLWRLSNEVQKLAAFKKNKTVEPEDVALLVKPKIETDIFRTISALAYKNKKQALSLMHEHLERGDHPLYLLAMISYQFRTLLTGRRKSLFTPEELKKIYRKIFEADYKIKIGQIEPQAALDLLITEI
jgi:DNA polymerase III subunit delta